MRKLPSIAALLLLAGAVAADRVEPGDLRYLGSWELPHRSETVGGRWGYGAHALAYSAERDALYGSSHVNERLVGAARVGEPGRIGEPEGVGEPVGRFVDTRGALADRPEFVRAPGERRPVLDRIGGVAVVGDRVWVAWQTYYAVQPFPELDYPTLHSVGLDLDDERGPFKVGPYGEERFGQKWVSNYLAAVPAAWAARYAPGHELAAGKADGAGSAGNSHGPSLVVVRTEPGNDGTLAAIPVLGYRPEAPLDGWSPCDRWEGLAWFGGTVLFAGRRGRGEACYGGPGPEECDDPCGGAKGYHCAPYGVDLALYDEDELGRVALGERGERVDPYAVIDVTPHLLPTCHHRMGAAAFDSRRARLYVVQESGERTRVHAWAWTRDPGPSPPSPPPPASHVVTIRDGDREDRIEGATRSEALARAIELLAGRIRGE